MDYQEFRAKTVDECITSATVKFGVPSDRLDYVVIDEGKAGFLFGIGSRDAVINARIKEKKVVEKVKKTVEEVKADVKPAANQVQKKSDRKPEKKAVEKKVQPSEKTETANVKAEKKAENKIDKPAKSEKKPAKNTEEKKADKAAGKAERKAEAFEKKEASAETPKKAENKKSVGGIITADEIEKRAAAAAARAKAEGIDLSDISENEERPKKRDRRDRRDRRNRRDRGERKGRKFNERVESAPAEVPEKQHKPSQPKPDRVVLPKTEEEVAEMKEKARTFLENIFRCMGINVELTMEYDQKEGCLGCTFSGDEMGILIGKRGQTLDSLQYLTSLVINKNKNDYTRVKLDTEDYRARRADTLENLSRNIAYKVKRTRRPVALEPMNPYERRIIHSSLQGNRYVETYSEGEEPYRHVVVAPKRQ
jgi:spoIIIJ-associated protein